jgi:hypothetical protein
VQPAAAAVKEPLRSAAAALSAGGSPPSLPPADRDSSIPFFVWPKNFLPEFEDVVNPSKALPHLQSSYVFHHMTGPPITSCFHRLDDEQLASLTSWKRRVFFAALTAHGLHLFL